MLSGLYYICAAIAEKRSTNVSIALSLVALALLFFFVTLVKLRGA